MRELKDLKELEHLNLADTKVNGMKQLEFPTNIKTLNLDSTGFTDEGMKQIKSLKKLENLSLNDARLSNTGFQEFRELNSLQTLKLTYVTDAGLKYLKELKSLQQLNLKFSWTVTDEGIKDLKKALPRLKITRE
jgi:hypothetical protein